MCSFATTSKPNISFTRLTRPGEARETDIGLTGGGKGTHQIYLSGMADHRLSNGDIVEHVVDLVETRVAELKAAEAASTQT